jgi:N-lysine methyltransferase SETD6
VSWSSSGLLTHAFIPRKCLSDIYAVATADIEQDEELFSIPRSAVLMTSNSDLAGKIPDEMQDLDPWLSLILVMLYEYLRGEESRWKPYFDVLPATFDTLMFWSSEELGELQASAVIHKIGKEQADVSFQEELLPVVSKHSDDFFPTGSQRLSNGELLEAMHRMGSLIMAYAFDIEREAPAADIDEEGYVSQEEDEALPKGMVPLADMLNADADRKNVRASNLP